MLSVLSRRRWVGALVLVGAVWVAGCATAPTREAGKVLAPTGELRVGVYAGSPTSLVVDPRTGAKTGIAYELGGMLAAWLGVPVRVVEFSRVAQVLEALKSGEVDLTFTNATEARAREADFAAPMVRLELGYLVPPGSRMQAGTDVDRAGVRVGVSQGSTSQGVLTRQFRSAKVVPVASLAQAQSLMRQGELDAFATNKGILNEMADGLPGYRILPGRWGLEQLALAIPKGREPGRVWVQQFAEQVQRDGRLQAVVARSGLRGLAAEP